MTEAGRAEQDSASMAANAAYETYVGPVERRDEPEGTVFRFTIAPHHLNGADMLHGGMMMSLASIVLGAIAKDSAPDEPIQAVSINCDFVGPGRAGDVVEGRGEITRRTRSIIFVNGTLTIGGKPIMTATGVWRIKAA